MFWLLTTSLFGVGWIPASTVHSLHCHRFCRGIQGSQPWHFRRSLRVPWRESKSDGFGPSMVELHQAMAISMGKSSTSKNVLLFHSTYFQTNPYHQALAKNWRSLITADHCQRTIARHCFWAKLWNVSVNELFQEYSYTVGVWIHYHWPIKICWNAAATFTCPLKLGLTHKHSESPEYSEDPRARSAAAMPWPVAGPQPAQDFCEVVYAHTIISISRKHVYIYICVCVHAND